jgi:phosphoglycerate dehydrogenase-like enzyme
VKLLVLSNFPIPEVRKRHVEAIQRCAEGFDVVVTDDREAQLEEIVDADVVFGSVGHPLFLQAKRLRWVQAVGAGIDSMLYPEFVQSDVTLTSEKGNVGIHLSEHAFALLLGVTRCVDRALRDPHWEARSAIRDRAWEIYDQTMGIVGLGGTGLAVAERAHAFGMRILAIDPENVLKPDYVEWVRPPDALGEMLGQSDVVVICAPLTNETRHLFNSERFAQMRPGAVLIDVTRGEIIDGPALLEALQSGRLGGAGLDTPPGEPIAADNPLWNMENVIVTPHTAGASPRRGDRIVESFCDNLRRFRTGEPLHGVIDKVKGY